jgi:NAD(P)-dependent dehydrogenase (short-subunit alcohol dehydrogenase family)
LQSTACIPHLRKRKGKIILTSSGAAGNAYVSWGPYGSSKAAANSLIAHIAAEEPDITAVAVSPGRVNTAMQQQLREHGKGVMAEKDHGTFMADFMGGRLNAPERPAGVLARLCLDASSDLSGKYFK